MRHLTLATITRKSPGANAAAHSMQMHVHNPGEVVVHLHLHLHERRDGMLQAGLPRKNPSRRI
jgi:hypothetical protein